MKIKKLSIVVPCYNEIRTIPAVFHSLQELALACEKEIIVVDDGSTDGSELYLREEAQKTYARTDTIILFHYNNQGKGACIRSALRYATGDYTIIQDADLEYDPSWIPTLLSSAETLEAPALYGSRASTLRNPVSSQFFALGARGLTWIFNTLYSQRITDLETCYKLVNTALLRSIDITEKRFGVEAEISAKIANRGLFILETPIRYQPRSRDSGKKIKARDGIRTLYLLFKFRLFDHTYGSLSQRF